MVIMDNCTYLQLTVVSDRYGVLLCEFLGVLLYSMKTAVCYRRVHLEYTVVGACAFKKPCRNGATCVNFKDNYICICMLGYEGKSCEIGNYPTYRCLKLSCDARVDVNISSCIVWYRIVI